MLWCFAELGGSLLVKSIDSQVFKSSNDFKMRKFFFSDKENSQIFQSTKRLGLIELEVLLASVSLWEVAPSHLGFLGKKLHIKASACLHKPPVHGDQDGKASTLCFLPANQEHPLPWAGAHPMGMRTAASKHGAWRAGLSQCLFIWVQIFITSAFQHLHMQTGDLKGNSCENTCLWPTLGTLYATLGCEFYMG